MTDQPQTRVLVVDDEPSIRSSLMGFLEDAGCEVCQAESGEQAFDALAACRCDVAIVDLRLPKMSGDTFIVQAHKISPGTRFLIYTGSVGYLLPDELLKVGLRQEHVFLKPVPDLSVFADAVARLMCEEGFDA